MGGVAGLLGQAAQLSEGERLLDEVALGEVDFFVREKLPRFFAAVSGGLAVVANHTASLPRKSFYRFI